MCVCMFLCFVVRMLREELQLLQEQGSYVGEVVKPMDKKKVLVKVNKEPQAGKRYLVFNGFLYHWFTWQRPHKLFEFV